MYGWRDSYTGNLHECKHQVYKEIPNGNNSNGEKLGDIKVMVSLADQEPNHHRIHSKADNGKEKKTGVFNS